MFQTTLMLGNRFFSWRKKFWESWSDILAELPRREKETNIKPDPDIDIFMKIGD
ncbi:unnamed protein product [Camellia sinensis]